MKIALLTCDNLNDYVAYEDGLNAALEKANIKYEWIVWEKYQDIDWSQFNAAIIRTTWDYQAKIDSFLPALEYISQKTQLWNNIDIVKWNSSKSYLLDFEDTQTKPVPTLPVTIESADDLKEVFSKIDSETIIIKPFVSATSHDTYKINSNNYLDISDKIIEVNQKKKLLAQPFMSSINDEGEYSLFFFNKEYSHAVLKTPKAGDFRSQEEYGSQLKAIQPDEHQMKYAKDVISRIDGELLYGRVDFVRKRDNEYYLMELELIEPSLYFAYDENSADRFVEAIKVKIN